MAKYILALDQGTTGSRAFIFDPRGRIVGKAYQEFPQYFPKPGWVEHDADEIWNSIDAVIRKAVKSAGIDSKDIVSIGITNQRETVVVWDRLTSRPLHRAIVWQCRRTSEICAGRRLKKFERTIQAKTGLVLDAYFSGTKIQWLLDEVKGLRGKAASGRVCAGTIDSWLIWKLTGGKRHVTDYTNASRTLLFNIRTLKWDRQLLKLLTVPDNILPAVQASGSDFGKTVSIAGLPAGIPIQAVMGDQQAALYGQGCHQPGTVKNTYGTGCFLVLNTGRHFRKSSAGLLTTIACDAVGQPVYALEGAVFIAGAVVQWLRDQLEAIESAPDSAKAMKNVKDTNGVYFVPAFVGLGAPYWDSEARGLITGLTRGSSKDHVIRAALEAIAYQTKDVFDAMCQAFGKRIGDLQVDGGACANDPLMQFQADLIRASVRRPAMIDSTVAGAAYLAGVVSGVWTRRQIKQLHQTNRIFKPTMDEKRANELYKGWQKAVRQARSK